MHLRVIIILIGAAAAAMAAQANRPQPAPERFTHRVVATGLAGPWEVTWGPDGRLWVTERTAKQVVRVNPADGSKQVAVRIPDVHQSVGQDGLLGLALHPDLSLDSGSDFVYVAFTYDDDPGPALARRLGVRRYRFDTASGTLDSPTDILRGLPSHDDHVAGRLAIGPDRRIYLSIGDGGANFGQNRCVANRAQELPTAADVQAKNWSSYWGKILRLDLDGGIPADNPEIDGVRSHIYSYGHRNQLGLAFAPDGSLYESEHGPSSDDEVNLILPGRNYGWPHVAGHRDGKAYAYANWSASTTPCASLPPGNQPPASVPVQTETAWNHALFTPPLQTFFTVETAAETRGLGAATIAPGGLAVYRAGGIPGWSTSVLALSLIRGVVYRLPLDATGRALAGPPTELFRSVNRYRDIAIHPGGKTFYLATDPTGPSRNPDGTPNSTLANPGAILEFTYQP